MIFYPDRSNITDLSGELKPGGIVVDVLELAMSFTEEDVTEAGVEPAELRQEAKLIASEDDIGYAIAIEIDTAGSVDRGELDRRGESLEDKLAMPFIKGDDRGGEGKLFDLGAVEQLGGEELLDGFFGVLGVFQVLFFEGRDLVFHIVFEEDGHIPTVDGTGEYFIPDAILIEVLYPEFDGMGGVGAEVEVFANVAHQDIGETVAIEVMDAEGLPPSEEMLDVGGEFVEAVVLEVEETGRHPFAGDEELRVTESGEVGPCGGGDHADVSDIGITGGGDVGEMPFAVIDIDKGGGIGAIFSGDGATADKQIGEAVVVEVGGNGYGGVATLGGGGEGIRRQGKVSFSIVEEEAELHGAAIRRVIVAAGADEQIGEAVVVGIEEEDGFVFEVGEGGEGGLG